MLYFQARPEIWEQGQLPLHTILPHLDSLTSLWAVHARLLARASKSDEDQSKPGQLAGSRGWPGQLPGCRPGPP